MLTFDDVRCQQPKEFLRNFGISLESFLFLVDKINEFFIEEKKTNPMKQRGPKPTICLEDRFLLTLVYLRNYSTFSQVGMQFGIHESYANKIFHRISHVLVKVLKMEKRIDLFRDDLEAIVIDVTEQPIERPKKGQKAYYSGKKKDIRLKFK